MYTYAITNVNDDNLSNCIKFLETKGAKNLYFHVGHAIFHSDTLIIDSDNVIRQCMYDRMNIKVVLHIIDANQLFNKSFIPLSIF